jgi:hypothetical protein
MAPLTNKGKASACHTEGGKTKRKERDVAIIAELDKGE